MGTSPSCALVCMIALKKETQNSIQLLNLELTVQLCPLSIFWLCMKRKKKYFSPLTSKLYTLVEKGQGYVNENPHLEKKQTENTDSLVCSKLKFFRSSVKSSALAVGKYLMRFRFCLPGVFPLSIYLHGSWHHPLGRRASSCSLSFL